MSREHASHWLEREDFGDVTVVRLRPPRKMLDDDTVRTVFEPITSLVSSAGRAKLVLSLGGVEFLPSMALGKLVMLNRKAEAANGRLALCQITPPVDEVLETTHLKGLFNCYATEQEAVQSFTAGDVSP
jgi:anti-anti-sigma factor